MQKNLWVLTLNYLQYLLWASFWNEYNEKNPVYYQKKGIHLYSYMESLEKISKTRLPARCEFYNEPGKKYW